MGSIPNKPQGTDLAALFNIAAWDSLPPGERQSLARNLAAALPDSFAFVGLNTFALGGQAHEIALFTFEKGRKFVLIPGSTKAILGYDRANPFNPSPEQAEEWQFTQEEYGITLGEYLDRYLTPLRLVAVEPMLVEVAANSVKCSLDGNQLSEMVKSCQANWPDFFRLPNNDEWEYICSGGTRTLFRWGDECPISNSYEETEWALHKQPNAFGACMSDSTYHSELCQDARLRGGDGGGSVCGGMGDVASWLPLATSFCVPAEELAGWYLDEVWVRQISPVSRVIQ